MTLPFIYSIIIILFCPFNYDTSLRSTGDEPYEIIEVKPSMVINETAIGNAEALVDEQITSTTPNSVWTIGWLKKEYFPLSAVIDLGEEYLVNKILIFDGKGSGNITLNIGIPFDWNKGFKYDQKKYNQWESFAVNKKTRYIQLVTGSNVVPYEIKVYGEPTGPKIKKRNLSEKTKGPAKTSMDKIIGVNAFIDDPIDKLKVASFVREYHNWRWDAAESKYPQSKYAWNPSFAGGGWNFDHFYSMLSKQGIEVIPCLKGNPDWIPGESEDKPIIKNLNPKAPQAYKAHADYLYQFVARYGGERINQGKLHLTSNQPVKSGMNLLSYIENWNEQNKTWEGRSAYFSPYEYAAMTSADYDAHLNTMGENVGIKNADPNFKLVMGGLAGLNLDYVKAIKFWSDFNRNGKVPFDVINLHHYCNSGNKNNPIGISPEEDNLRERLEEIVEYRNKVMPSKEIWITEFGYDTHPQSPQRVPLIEGLTREEVQAQWLVRSYLEIAAAGIDKAAIYMLRDVNSESKVKYATSGLTWDKEHNWKLKPSWNYIYTLKSCLKGMYFKDSKEIEGVRIYKFTNPKTNNIAYVLWSPTAEAKRIPNYKFRIEENNAKALLINLSKQKKEGIEKTISITNHQITADISETPIFIILK